MLHFRGRTDGAGKWLPLCASVGNPEPGELTTKSHDVDCPHCLSVLRVPKSKHWSPTEQKLKPQSREHLDRKQLASGES